MHTIIEYKSRFVDPEAQEAVKNGNALALVHLEGGACELVAFDRFADAAEFKIEHARGMSGVTGVDLFVRVPE